jgi:hypothetical protein
MPSMPLYRLAGVVFCASVYAAGACPALADVIDGHWCFQDGKRISIQGPAIVTPAGSQIQGDYSRHFFTYVVPQADPDAGQTVSMTLINEDTVHLRIGTAPSYSSDGPVQVWHRCGPPTS